MKPMFKHDDFEFGYEIAWGSVTREYADAGEVLATAGRIKDADADTSVREWTATALANEAAAQAAEAPDIASAPGGTTSAPATTATPPGCT
jgi:hypothetical protein